MKKYVIAAIMFLYIGLSIIIINYVSDWMMKINYSVFVSKARDIAILTDKNFRLTDAEVKELENLEFAELLLHPANIRLADMFSDKADGFDDIRFVYILTKLEEKQIKYHVTEECEDFYGAQAGTPLNTVWLIDVVPGKTLEEILDEDATYYDDIRRYSYLRDTNEAAFRDKVPTHAIAHDEYGYEISYFAPFYTEEGSFVGLLGIDIHIDEYERNAKLLKLLLFIVFLVPSLTLTALYILLYVVNLKKALHTSTTDALTSAKNRRFMDKYLTHTIKDHYKKLLPLSIIMIDIDFFKKYNDNYGHQQGDKVLIEVTQAIASVLRVNLDVICRYGGEEFIVMLPNTKAPDASRVAERIKTTVNGLAIKHEYTEIDPIITVSQGIYSAVPLSGDAEKLFIEYADKALYMAKNAGRNRYIFIEAE
ncbi:MAG: GGDEF domain-containing protein [Treponema sp.]|jgi:diguanylate cyclase (GGDEF)-like protein|nr:GGDEF domain-containing protein [Treponema sp.]